MADIKFSIIKKVIFSFLILITAFLGLLPFFISSDLTIKTNFIIIDFKILSWIIYITILYNIFFNIKNNKKADSIEKKAVLKAILILQFIFLPLFFLEYFWNFNFKNQIRPITLTNLNYFISNLISIILFYKYIFILPKFSSKKIIPDNFIKKFKITLREKEIINIIAMGLANKEIADKLKITELTVKNHIYNIYQKTNAQSRVDLINLLNDEMLIK